MTIEQKFTQGTVLYKNDENDYVLELWGGSTKHPDSIFYFSDFNKVNYLSDEMQLFQWICECASKLALPFHAVSLVKWALKNYSPYDM